MPAKRRERQPSLSVEFRCEVCEEIPPKNEKDSNANWSVYPTVCPSDGGRVTGRVVEHASAAQYQEEMNDAE